MTFLVACLEITSVVNHFYIHELNWIISHCWLCNLVHHNSSLHMSVVSLGCWCMLWSSVTFSVQLGRISTLKQIPLHFCSIWSNSDCDSQTFCARERPRNLHYIIHYACLSNSTSCTHLEPFQEGSRHLLATWWPIARAKETKAAGHPCMLWLLWESKKREEGRGPPFGMAKCRFLLQGSFCTEFSGQRGKWGLYLLWSLSELIHVDIFSLNFG